jgi:uncharacterized protein (UPF0305 family)
MQINELKSQFDSENNPEKKVEMTSQMENIVEQIKGEASQLSDSYSKAVSSLQAGLRDLRKQMRKFDS